MDNENGNNQNWPIIALNYRPILRMKIILAMILFPFCRLLDDIAFTRALGKVLMMSEETILTNINGNMAESRAMRDAQLMCYAGATQTNCRMAELLIMTKTLVLVSITIHIITAYELLKFNVRITMTGARWAHAISFFALGSFVFQIPICFNYLERRTVVKIFGKAALRNQLFQLHMFIHLIECISAYLVILFSREVRLHELLERFRRGLPLPEHPPRPQDPAHENVLIDILQGFVNILGDVVVDFFDFLNILSIL